MKKIHISILRDTVYCAAAAPWMCLEISRTKRVKMTKKRGVDTLYILLDYLYHHRPVQELGNKLLFQHPLKFGCGIDGGGTEGGGSVFKFQASKCRRRNVT